MTEISLQLKVIQIENPDQLNMILGQSHFIKTVEDIHEAVVTSLPNAKFGLAFCESSGAALVRSTGTDDALKALAERNALALGAGHAFILFLRDAYPINVLNAIKLVPEVANIYCASANPVQVILAETEQGRG
ncbi:MAG: adenosine-specific kinase, partial [Anaerolineae bacterium]|nr:adenosine-specific kinase [Anaerolineae bacterium]